MLAIFANRLSETLFSIGDPPQPLQRIGYDNKFPSASSPRRTRPYSYEPELAQKVALRKSSQRTPGGSTAIVLSTIAPAVLWAALLRPVAARGAAWPWTQPPDQVSATCSIQPEQIEQGSGIRLQVKMDATDTRKHPLAYVWSGNGGQIFGNGAAVEVDASGLNPGIYSLAGAAQDAYRNRAECVAHFQVTFPPVPLSAQCTAEPAEVEQGAAVKLKVEAAGRLGRPLFYRWFTNGGLLQADGAAAQLATEGLVPGEYSITSRVEDEWGHATDCMATVKVRLPPPPPIPPEVMNLAQLLFPRNLSMLGANERYQLEKVIERLRNDPAGRVSLESYAGPDETNPERLAAERAAVVRQHLMENGVSEARVQTVLGLGGWLGGLRNRTLDVVWIPDGMEY